MKRTGFIRAAYSHATAPLTPATRTGVVRRVSDEVRAVPKVLPVRSESYRRWVSTLPCIVCGLVGFSQCAHPNSGRGLGQKASDLDCFPLCCVRGGTIGHHQEHDLLIDMTLEERREREKRYTAQTQQLAREVGRPEIA